MSYKIELTDNFIKEAKKLYKKYPSLKHDLGNLFSILETTPNYGTSLGNNVFKIRIAISSKNKGKSGGARVISYVKISHTTVLLFSIYDKGVKETITDKEIEELLRNYI